MIGNLIAITEDQLQAFIEDTDLLEKYIYQDDSEEFNKTELDIDKSWHAIHFILTKDPWKGNLPESLAILGGTEIGEDVGYGPALYINSQQVKQVSEMLKTLDYDKIKCEYKPQEFEKAEIYPQGIWSTEKEQALEYVLDYLKELIVFYEEAARNNQAMIKYLN